MKKVWLVLLALLVIGIGTVGAQAWTTNAPANFQLRMPKNEWGPGCQGKVDAAWLFNGQQVKAGDKYELEITFRVSRELRQMQVMLVDCSPAANYWTELSTDKPVFEETMPTNTDITKKVTFTAQRDATAATAMANTIVFDTQTGTTTVTVTFSKFTLKKL
jgi:hypothetical protein